MVLRIAERPDEKKGRFRRFFSTDTTIQPLFAVPVRIDRTYTDWMPFSFAFVADTHLIHADPGQSPMGERARLSESFYQSLIRSVNAVAPDLVIHGGDVACGGHGFGANSEVFAASMARAKELESAFSAPCRYCCGNHDVDPAGGGNEIFVRDYCPGGTSYHSFVAQGWRFVMVDSQDLPDDRVHGHLGDAQLQWFDAELSAATRSGERALVFSHHPAVVTPDQLGIGCVIDNPDEVLSVLQSCENVVAVFSGHLHLNRIWEHEGIWQVWSAALDSHPCTWRKVTVPDSSANEQTMSIETVRIELTDEMAALSQQNLDHALRDLQEGSEADRTVKIELT